MKTEPTMLPSGRLANAEHVAIADDARQITLVETLALAVPLWMDEIRDLTDAQRVARAKRCGAMVAERGDVLQFGSTRPGKAAEVFNALAEGLACAAYQPGGVTFAGRHWCTDHRLCEDAAAYAASAPRPVNAPEPAIPAQRAVADVTLADSVREAL